MVTVLEFNLPHKEGQQLLPESIMRARNDLLLDKLRKEFPLYQSQLESMDSFEGKMFLSVSDSHTASRMVEALQADNHRLVYSLGLETGVRLADSTLLSRHRSDGALNRSSADNLQLNASPSRKKPGVISEKEVSNCISFLQDVISGLTSTENGEIKSVT